MTTAEVAPTRGMAPASAATRCPNIARLLRLFAPPWSGTPAPAGASGGSPSPSRIHAPFRRAATGMTLSLCRRQPYHGMRTCFFPRRHLQLGRGRRRRFNAICSGSVSWRRRSALRCHRRPARPGLTTAPVSALLFGLLHRALQRSFLRRAMIRGHSTATIGLCECQCPSSLCLRLRFHNKNCVHTLTLANLLLPRPTMPTA